MHEPPAPPPPGTRLNGWKDIANHLGKGVRTVQRWEKVYGLPIHRIGQDGGDIVFAFVTEIDAWLVEFERRRRSGAIDDDDQGVNGARDPVESPGTSLAEPSPSGHDSSAPVAPGPAQPRAFPARWFVASLIVAAMAIGVMLSRAAWPAGDATTPPEAGAGQPAHWRVDDDTLVVFDAAMRELWRYPFDADIDERAYQQAALTAFVRAVIIEDLDGDGSREVLFRVISTRQDRQEFLVFNADGARRFAHVPTSGLTFGDEEFVAPWRAHGMAVTRSADGAKHVWVAFTHHLWFPTRLVQFDARGDVVGQYVSNGFVSSVDVGQWHGRPAVFVGAANNEHRGASLAIFSGTTVHGTAPAAVRKYACTRGCDPDVPDAFIVFPGSCLIALEGGAADIYRAWEDGTRRVIVMVRQARGPYPGEVGQAVVSNYYEIAADLASASVEVSREFDLMHAHARSQRRIDHDLGERDRQHLLPVQRWEAGRYVAMAAGDMRR